MRLTAILITCIMTLLGFGLISAGSQWLNEAQTFPEPSVLTYARFTQEMPLSGWFEVKGGYVNPAEAAYIHINFRNAEELARSRSRNRADTARATEAYLPVHLKKEYDLKARAVLLTRDPMLLKTVNELRALLRSGSDIEVETWLEKRENSIWVRKDFKGMVRPSSEVNPIVSTLLRDSLTEPFVFVEEGKQPSLTSGLYVIGSGIFVLILLCLYWYHLCKRGPVRPRQPPLDMDFE